MTQVVLSGAFVRIPKVSDGRQVCDYCKKTIKRGIPYEEQGTTNERGFIECKTTFCPACLKKQVFLKD